MSGPFEGYGALLTDVKARVQGAQVRAAIAANRELLRVYWDVGRLIHVRQTIEGWGAGVVRRLAADLAGALPEVKGFSERNLKRMIRFYRAFPEIGALVDEPDMFAIEAEPSETVGPVGPEVPARPEAKVPQAVAPTEARDPGAFGAWILDLPWGHHFLVLEKVKVVEDRRWYMRQALQEGWSRDVLAAMIKSGAHARQGAAVTNFKASLPAPQSDLAQQTIKDPYIFDFLTLDGAFRERELELGLLAHLERFLLELGVGFAFVGRQHHVALGDDDFYLDLLFYHLRLRCFVVIDLKVGPFRAEYAGKMNLYLNLVDDALRHATDQPSIGLILCQDRKQILAEYALRGMDKPIGVSEYELTRALPAELASSLPTIDAIEAELSGEGDAV